MRFDVFTLFPEWFDWMRRPRHLANAARRGPRAALLLAARHHAAAHGQVDDSPYGGGAGMVMRVDVIAARARGRLRRAGAERVASTGASCVLTPRGGRSTDAVAGELAAEPDLALLCGRYEGFDERVTRASRRRRRLHRPLRARRRRGRRDGRHRRGVRKLPGALGNAESLASESFSAGLGGGLEYPHYTRPAVYRGWEVPEVLLLGRSRRDRRWRAEQVACPPRGREAGRGSLTRVRIPCHAPGRFAGTRPGHAEPEHAP